ncbi:NAD(P)-dependent alcohol dehydrogenase [Paraliomyxa miuraensis]|uniref:NAD(P)-dependent alcohol dehydrogenase n=1 Tax=Paraliomyxa miuraensis TaxID=376150 RepID=UPI002253B98C|nr:NAD(P)-dependent alcohol dehydrogenase [Paraliomyxa miuraensis]MCX4245180.1 NAD(P)-dependent alcohol dehydrogenase [Paraliomyxa miuraensis]
MKIVAAVARAGQPFSLEECELGPPGPGEIQIAVEACGICQTDLSAKDHGYGTPLPAVLGHEGVGRVEALGDGVLGLAKGDRVVMSFGACGRCGSCRDHHPAYCRHAVGYNVLGRREDGSSPLTLRGEPITGHFFGQSSFATHTVARATSVVRVPDDLPARLLAPLGCGVQTGVGAVADVLAAGPEHGLCVLGCGTVGLSAVMAAKRAGCARIVAVDLRPERLERALALGATHAIDNGRQELSTALRELSLGLALDVTGQPEVIEATLAALRPRGTLVLAGLSPRGARLSLDPNRLMASGRTVRGTVEGDADPKVAIPRLLQWHRRGQLPLEAIVTPYPFERINEAVEDMRTGTTVKPVLMMPSP